MRWRLYIEEYSPDLIYLKGEDNQAANALSRLPKSDNPKSDNSATQQSTPTVNNQGVDAYQMDPAKFLNMLHVHHNPEAMEQYSLELCSELFNEEPDPDWNPVTYNQIYASQQTDTHLKNLLKLDNCCLTQNTFHRGGKPYQLWTFRDKIYIP